MIKDPDPSLKPGGQVCSVCSLSSYDLWSPTDLLAAADGTCNEDLILLALVYLFVSTVVCVKCVTHWLGLKHLCCFWKQHGERKVRWCNNTSGHMTVMGWKRKRQQRKVDPLKLHCDFLHIWNPDVENLFYTLPAAVKAELHFLHERDVWN